MLEHPAHRLSPDPPVVAQRERLGNCADRNYVLLTSVVTIFSKWAVSDAAFNIQKPYVAPVAKAVLPEGAPATFAMNRRWLFNNRRPASVRISAEKSPEARFLVSP
jgi:hypothetical protein